MVRGVETIRRRSVIVIDGDVDIASFAQIFKLDVERPVVCIQ